MPFLNAFAPWVPSLVATVVTAAVAYLAGHLFNGIVMRRLARAARLTREDRCALGLRVRDFVDQFAVRHELVKRLQARFARESIALAIPSMRVVAALRPPTEAPAE